jgi:DNA processing protein
VPGNVHSSKSTGTHLLIKQGAKLVETVEDIFEELPHTVTSHTARNQIPPEEVLPEGRLPEGRLKDLPPLSAEEQRVMGALGPYPVHIDVLVRSLDMDPGVLSAILMRMELKGIVAQTPGKMFSIETDKIISVSQKC